MKTAIALFALISALSAIALLTWTGRVEAEVAGWVTGGARTMQVPVSFESEDRRVQGEGTMSASLEKDTVQGPFGNPLRQDFLIPAESGFRLRVELHMAVKKPYDFDMVFYPLWDGKPLLRKPVGLRQQSGLKLPIPKLYQELVPGLEHPDWQSPLGEVFVEKFTDGLAISFLLKTVAPGNHAMAWDLLYPDGRKGDSIRVGLKFTYNIGTTFGHYNSVITFPAVRGLVVKQTKTGVMRSMVTDVETLTLWRESWYNQAQPGNISPVWIFDALYPGGPTGRLPVDAVESLPSRRPVRPTRSQTLAPTGAAVASAVSGSGLPNPTYEVGAPTVIGGPQGQPNLSGAIPGAVLNLDELGASLRIPDLRPAKPNQAAPVMPEPKPQPAELPEDGYTIDLVTEQIGANQLEMVLVQATKSTLTVKYQTSPSSAPKVVVARPGDRPIRIVRTRGLRLFVTNEGKTREIRFDDKGKEERE